MGWILLERKITEHFLWDDKPFSQGQAWIDLLLLANHKDHKLPYKGEIITCKRGEVNRSISWLASRWGWSRKKTRSFLGLLEGDGMVATKVSTNRTTITIENYAFYQSHGTTKEQRKEQRRNSEGINEGTHTKKDKEGKRNIITLTSNNNNSVVNTPPTIGEVKEYILQGGYAVDAEEFIDYYSGQGWTKANGKPVVDWRACVRSWHRRRKGKTAEADAKAEARSKALAELEETERRMVAEANEKVKSRKEHE